MLDGLIVNGNRRRPACDGETSWTGRCVEPHPPVINRFTGCGWFGLFLLQYLGQAGPLGKFGLVLIDCFDILLYFLERLGVAAAASWFCSADRAAVRLRRLI